MLNLFLKTFKTATEGIILAVPLVLFMWIMSLYLSYASSVVDSTTEIVLALITILFMASAFCAGWFYMVKKCIEFSKKDFILDEDKANESLKLIKTFPIGIGKFFLRYVEISLIFTGILTLISAIMYFISLPFIRSINFSLPQMNTVLNSPQETLNFLNSLSPEQLLQLFKLNIIIMAITYTFAFLLILWMPEVIYKECDPLFALFTSIRKIFSKFWKTLGLFVYILVVNFIISFLGTFAFVHPITYMIMSIIYFYFIVYLVVLIFLYYDREFNKIEKDKKEST